MKYYKLIKLGGGYDSGIAPFIVNKIYSGNFKGTNLCTVEKYAFGSEYWQEVPAGDYFVQEGVMPEYFAIKRVEGNPLWGKYIDWWQKQFKGTLYTGVADKYYGFKGRTSDVRNAIINKELPESCIELTLEQWDKIINKTMEEFKLPAKWCTKIDNQEVVDYCNIHGLFPPYKIIKNENMYAHFPSWNDYTTCCEVKPGYIEITKEQFIKYVLKQEVMEDKEIIGWKLKEDCKKYEQAALNIVNQSKFYNFAEGYNFETNSSNESDLKKAGVLELWFIPVYKEKTLQFGGYNVIFEKVTSGVRITCNGETGTFSQVEAIYNYFKPNSTYFKFGSQEIKKITYGQNGSWNLENESDNPTEIKIGCTTGTWKEFVAIYEKAKSML